MEMHERNQKNRLLKLCFVFLLTVGALLLLCIGASAVPALSEERQFAQPNGVQFLGTLHGDEYFHFLEAQDGSILTQGDDGYWYYAEKKEIIADGEIAADLVPSRARYLIEQAPDQASQMTREQLRTASFQYRRRETMAPQAAPGVEAQAKANVLGDQNLLIILVDFNNASIQYESQWPGAIFGSTGKTVKTFYQEATGGQINIVPARETYGAVNDGVVRVKLNRNHPNQQASNITDFASVITAASAYVDFASFDANNDGKIEAAELHIVMIYAGYEAAYGYESPSVWAHHLNAGFLSINVAATGKRFTNYTCMGERHGDHRAMIGTMCHELGHSLGLPDLYCNDWSAPDKTLTGISIMGGGWEYLAGEYPGATPVLLDAYCLDALGALTPQAVPDGQTLTAQVKSWSSGAKNSLKVASGVPNEYFLIECRYKEGFDSALDGIGGVAVYRVNTKYDNNLDAGRFLASWLWLDPDDIPYDEHWSEEWDAGYLFYSTRPSGRTYINANTAPSNMLSDRGGYSWFRFDCLSDSAPSMDVSIQPDKQSGFYTVSYDANGGSGGPVAQYKKHGVNLTLSSRAPARTGYTFLGWSTSDTTETATYGLNGSFTLNADTTLYAVWRAATYTVTYNANGGSGAPARQTKTHGIDLNLSNGAPTRTGYDFLGWAASNSATAAQYRPGDAYTADADITLYAVWQAKTYTISYDANGGSGEPADQTKTHNTALTLDSGQPTRAGYTFLGWAATATAAAAQYQPGGSYTANADATLYAVWKGNAYTVTLDANGGSVSPESITVTNGGTYSALPTPARGGYGFDGWYTADGIKVNKADVVHLAGNLTLYARWTGNTYTVALNANGGSVSPESITVTNGGTYSALPTPARDGYNFEGWYTAASGGTRVNPTDTANLTGNTTLYARWAVIKGIFGTNARWYGAWWHYLLFFIGFGFIWMWF